MLTRQLLIFTLLFALAFAKLKSVEELAETVSAVDADSDSFRAISASWFPSANTDLFPARTVSIKGISIQKTGESSNEVSGEADAVVFAASNSFFPTSILFAYFHASGSVDKNSTNIIQALINGDVSANAFAFFLRMFTVFEFDETNGQAGFQPEDEEIVGWYDLTKACISWKPMVINKTSHLDGNGNEFDVHYFTMETKDEVFQMRFTIAGRPISVQGIKLTPESIKIDVNVKYFENDKFPKGAKTCGIFQTYATGPSDPVEHPNATVGILSFISYASGSAEISQASEGSKPTVTVTSTTGNSGFFTWEETADITVQGVQKTGSVNANVISNKFPSVKALGSNSPFNIKGQVSAKFTTMFFSFDAQRPREVSWDPEFGSGYNGISAVVPSFFVVMMALIASLF